MVLSLGYNNELGVFDLVSGNGQLEAGNSDLPTLFATALFTSSISTPQFNAWPGNSYSAAPLGSRLSLLARGVKSGNGQILSQAKNYVVECLNPYLTLGIITSLSVQTSWSTSSGVALLTITINAGVPNSATPVLTTFNINPTGTAIIQS